MSIKQIWQCKRCPFCDKSEKGKEKCTLSEIEFSIYRVKSCTLKRKKTSKQIIIEDILLLVGLILLTVWCSYSFVLAYPNSCYFMQCLISAALVGYGIRDLINDIEKKRLRDKDEESK